MKLSTYPDLEELRPAREWYEAGTDFYAQSYPHLLKSVGRLSDDRHGDAIVFIAHVVYGWMPTILKSCDVEAFQRLDRRPLKCIRQVSKASVLDELLPERSPVNGSWVGLSKFLHFVNPNVFPIWDGRVARHFGFKYSQSYNRKSVYFAYCDWVEQHAESAPTRAMRKFTEEKYQYTISNVRAVELCLFLR